MAKKTARGVARKKQITKKQIKGPIKGPTNGAGKEPFRVKRKMATPLTEEDSHALVMAKGGLKKHRSKRIVLKYGTIDIIPVLDVEWAELLMSNMPVNRGTKPYHLAKIQRAIIDGRFLWTGNPIVILDAPGKPMVVVDGQHRLVSILVTGVPIEDAVLVTVYDPNVVKVLDTTHRPRTVGDIEEMMGDRRTAKAVVAAIKMESTNFQLRAGRHLAKDEEYDLIREYDFLEEAIALYRAGQNNKAIRITSGPVAGALSCIRRNIKIKDFVLQWFLCCFTNEHTVYYESEGRREPNVKLLSDWLAAARLEQQLTKNVTTGETWKLESAEKTIRAWNAWCEGKELKKLQRGRDRQVPVARSGLRRLQKIRKAIREAEDE